MKRTDSGTFGGGHSLFKPLREKGYVLIEDGECPFRFVWLNRATRTTVTYCEGDVITEECESEEELTAHIERLRAFYGKLLEEADAA